MGVEEKLTYGNRLRSAHCKELFFQAYCVHMAVEKGLEKCAEETIKTVGVPEEFIDDYNYYDYWG